MQLDKNASTKEQHKMHFFYFLRIYLLSYTKNIDDSSVHLFFSQLGISLLVCIHFCSYCAKKWTLKCKSQESFARI